eukprot:12399474-Karenia_brevis.AAC.1
MASACIQFDSCILATVDYPRRDSAPECASSQWSTTVGLYTRHLTTVYYPRTSQGIVHQVPRNGRQPTDSTPGCW